MIAVQNFKPVLTHLGIILRILYLVDVAQICVLIIIGLAWLCGERHAQTEWRLGHGGFLLAQPRRSNRFHDVTARWVVGIDHLRLSGVFLAWHTGKFSKPHGFQLAGSDAARKLSLVWAWEGILRNYIVTLDVVIFFDPLEALRRVDSFLLHVYFENFLLTVRVRDHCLLFIPNIVVHLCYISKVLLLVHHLNLC